MKKITLLLIALMLSSASAFAAEVDWKLDNSHSKVAFTIRHLGFAKVRGSFTEFSADAIVADDKTGKLSKLTATVNAKSVDTDNDTRDNHLRSDDFFAADQHPELKLNLKKVTWTGDNFTAEAEMTIRSTTKPVTFKGELLGMRTVNFGKGPQLRAGYTAETTINRKEFGLKFNKVAEGVAVAADDVTIILDAEIWRTVE